jgi:hypothetical protein
MPPQQPQQTQPSSGSGFGWAVLGFFIPLVGLILFCVWRGKPESKKKAKAAGIGAIVGFVCWLAFSVFVGVNVSHEVAKEAQQQAALESKQKAEAKKEHDEDVANAPCEYEDGAKLCKQLQDSEAAFNSANSALEQLSSDLSAAQDTITNGASSSDVSKAASTQKTLENDYDAYTKQINALGDLSIPDSVTDDVSSVTTADEAYRKAASGVIKNYPTLVKFSNSCDITKMTGLDNTSTAYKNAIQTCSDAAAAVVSLKLPVYSDFAQSIETPMKQVLSGNDAKVPYLSGLSGKLLLSDTATADDVSTAIDTVVSDFQALEG